MKKIMFAFGATVALTMFPQIGSADNLIANLKADVPVGFHVSNAALPQGSYRMIISSLAGGTPMVRFTHLATNRSAMATAMRSRTTEARASPAIQFRCVDGACYVAGITVYDGKWSFAPRKLTPEQLKRLYTMTVPLDTLRPAD